MIVRIQNRAAVRVTRQVHERRFRQLMRNLTPVAFQRISDAVNDFIDTKGRGEVVTSSWIPGANWNGTPYEPIHLAVGGNWHMARLFFGLIVWSVVMQRPETWSFGRYPKRQGDIIGMTYFQIH